MKKTLLTLLLGASLPAHHALAQTSPPPTTPEGKENVWMIFDHPVPKPAVATESAPAMQGPTYVPLDQDTYRLIDRYAIKYGADTLHDPYTAVRPYHRRGVARLGQRILQDSSGGAALSAADRFNAEYLLRDNWNYLPQAQYGSLNRSRRPFLKNTFYQNQTDFYSVKSEDFVLRVNPVLLLQVGKDTENSDGIQYVNTRGVQVEGIIDERLGFYTFLADNQMAAPQYVQNRTQRDQIVPHEGYWKYFKTQNSNQYDFFTARGGITYAASKHISLQLAHDRNFIGNGYRSLILSDYSAPYFFLKANTRVWKFNYQNLFAQMTAQRENRDQVYPKKYLALHHLSFDVTSNFNIGVFESTMFGSDGVDTIFTRKNGPVLRPRRRFEAQYLNPVIFYRAIEQQIGSADNALLGLDFKWNIKRRAQVYGQLVLDEFKISEVRAGNGWVGNRQSFQLGGKLIDLAGIDNLDLQVEFNYIRPYTYQHEDNYTNYQHYQQPLAHPMGANLYEILGVVSYQPLPRLSLVGKAFYTKQGLDNQPTADPELNYGGNILKDYNTGLVGTYGNTVGQGNTTKLLHGDLTASYMLRHNLWLDAKQIVRHQTGAEGAVGNGTESFSSVSLRWNIAQRLHEF